MCKIKSFRLGPHVLKQKMADKTLRSQHRILGRGASDPRGTAVSCETWAQAAAFWKPIQAHASLSSAQQSSRDVCMNAVGNAGGARAHAEMPAADLIRLPSERTVASWKLGRPQLADQAFMNRICKDGAWCKHGKVVKPAKKQCMSRQPSRERCCACVDTRLTVGHD